MSFTIQRLLGIAPVMILGLLLLTPAPGLAQVPKPDLVVTSLVSPPGSVLPGDSFVVTTSVKNQGPGPAAASLTSFFLVPTTGPKKKLKGAQTVEALGPGASGAPPATVAIYSDTVPGTYSFQACADADTTVGEVNEFNNCLTAPGTITVNDVPNLAVTALSEPPASVPQGQSFAPPTTYTVKNTGAVSAGASLVKFYLAATVGTTRVDMKTADPEAVGTLGPGATFTHAVTLIVRPETVPGTYRLQACSDSRKTVTELNENDNCKTSVGTVQITPQPDLVVRLVTVTGAPLTVEQGGSLAIGLNVRNLGLLDAPASTLKFRLVSTGVTPLQKGLGTVVVPAVPAGTKVTINATPVVDEETVPGTYIVQACADYDKHVSEISDKNNCGTAPGTVTVTGVPLSLADLAVTALTTPPATRLPGETFPLTATVVNNGTGASSSTTSKFYLVNALVNATIRKNLKGVQIVDPLAAGATNATQVTVEVYSDTVPGSYFLQACADGEKQLHESNENDNCFTSPSPITVSPAPDLAVTAMGNPPAAVVAGQTFSATTTYSVTNTGPVAAGTSTAKFYLVSTVDATRIDLKGNAPDLALPALVPAQVFNHAVALKVRANTPSGSYTLLGCADSGKVVVESDEDDNCKASATTVQVTGLPDLIVSAVRLAAPSVTVSRGGTLPITAVVRNQGFSNAVGSTLKLSLVVSPGAAPVKTLPESPAVPAVALGTKQTVQATVTIPSTTPLGTYVVQACVDAAKLVAEASDENNCGTSVATINVVQ